MIKDTQFFNSESERYSSKRYPERASSYTQYFFKKRLHVVMSEMRKIADSSRGKSILEVGCADGVVLRRIYDEFGKHFSSYKGIDIASQMIDQAKKLNEGRPIVYDVRNPGLGFGFTLHSIVIEVGVINYTDLAQEIECALQTLSDGGMYLISVAGRGSLWDRFRKGDSGFANFLAFKEYERKLSENFEVVDKTPVGFFIPLIWRVPFLAKPISHLFEALLRPILPGFFHEKVYVLKKKA